MSTTLPPLDSLTGALLIGTWASSLLYMAELLQVIKYFRTYKKDDWKLKSYVAIAFAIDTISATADYACVYLYTITHAGDRMYMAKQNWGMPLYIISTTTVALMVQSFLAFLYWRFPEKNMILVCFLSILILAAFGGGLASGLTIVLFPAFKDRSKVRISGTVWIITQVSADLIIAGALVREFVKAKSVFKGQRRINSVLKRLVSQTIQTGTATAVIAVLALVVFLYDDETNIPVGILYISGRVYILTMLINLNIREFPRRAPNAGTTSGQRETVRIAHGTTYNLTELYPSEPDSNTSGSVKSSLLLSASQPSASISQTQPPEIEMVPIDTKHVPEV
ncbi:hypothetical protein MSAN_02350100 [Mycena sanguinolenta]|uniref:DUF6534 domain-containing protein n=1 Tax=Mycena sanguinolenta TaxID=230812 RepID=A0A8H7CEZ3_9AGAR|nr:hypothetical protein MSAN_02350100 [Mycena sanguinolenta]